ncbi:MAG: MBL fold metallo-hydrolase [Actinomycetota bacterium]|nr:MBL fold metallo-hydrolase [Actinomycetota bacterium]
MADVAPLHPSSARFTGGLREVTPGVHAWLQPNGTWGESNAGLVVGDGASVLVDTLWDVRLTARMLDAMQPLVERTPIVSVVNTHSDGDHWWGNQLVAKAEIVATEAAARVMAGQSHDEMLRFGRVGAALRLAGGVPVPYPRRDDVATIGSFVGEVLGPFEFGEVRVTRPTRTFHGELTLEVGGRELQLIEVGPAHTPGDLVVYVPDARTVFAADILFIGVTPVMWAGPVERWLAALERLIELGAETFVPGHGPVCGVEEVMRLADYWRWLEAAARRRLAGGGSPAAVARDLVLGEEIAARGFADWLDPERAVINVRTIDAHRRGVARPPGPREVVNAFARMALLARDRRRVPTGAVQ